LIEVYIKLSVIGVVTTVEGANVRRQQLGLDPVDDVCGKDINVCGSWLPIL